MKIGHLSCLLSAAGGGIPPVIFSLAAAQRSLNDLVRVWGVEDPAQQVERSHGLSVLVASSIGPPSFGFAPGLATAIYSDGPDVIHLHGLFTWPSIAARWWRRLTRGALIISPHGMLDAWALNRSAVRKKAFLWWVEGENLRRAACLHALCAAEAEGIRRLGIETPVAIVPNGVDLCEEAEEPDVRQFARSFPAVAGRRMLLFLGRIHPKKGLRCLLEAWADLKSDGLFGPDGWLLVIAGPDQLNHTAEMKLLAKSLGVERDVLFTGQLLGEAKAAAYAAADAFVLPSLSEGFPMAVLEAMAARVPVLVTRQCNLDVEAFDGGLLCDPTRLSVASGVRTILSMSPAQRKQMGRRGRREVEERYTWPGVARQLREVYAWALGSGERPGCLV